MGKYDFLEKYVGNFGKYYFYADSIFNIVRLCEKKVLHNRFLIPEKATDLSNFFTDQGILLRSKKIIL